MTTKDHGMWDCHKCPERFETLRELNQHLYRRTKANGLVERKCKNPHPASQWHIAKVAKQRAEIADLKARITQARRCLRNRRHPRYERALEALDLRRREW